MRFAAKLMEKYKIKKKCAYFDYCYIAEARDCFGYKTDCPIYMATNDEKVSESRFHKAMDKLINKVKVENMDTKISGTQKNG